MRKPTRPLGALALVAVLALAGCGDDGGGSDSDSADNAGSDTSATQSPSADESGDEDGGAAGEDHGDDDHGNGGDGDGGDGNGDAVEVEIEIEDGQTAPAGERITVQPGQTIKLEVDSDTADELHVHADPEHSFTVKPTDDQTFEFAIDQPGVYEMESHETGTQVISIQVQP
jgi:plastocyanin